MIKNISLIILLICCFNIVFGQYIDNEKKQIIGTWVTEEASIKFIFASDMKCYQYYKGKLSQSYRYKISNITPQCGEQVLVDKETSYLELISLKDSKKACYEINGIGAKTLSLTAVGYASPTVYKRVVENVGRKTKHHY